MSGAVAEQARHTRDSGDVIEAARIPSGSPAPAISFGGPTVPNWPYPAVDAGAGHNPVKGPLLSIGRVGQRFSS